jgi:hypothetical protein
MTVRDFAATLGWVERTRADPPVIATAWWVSASTLDPPYRLQATAKSRNGDLASPTRNKT